MRLGIGSYAFAWSIGVPGREPPRPMTALDLVDAAADLGVRVVQICDNLPLHILAEPELDRLAGRAAEHGIQVEVGTRGIGREHLRRYLRLAVRLRSPILRVVVDAADHRPALDEIVAMLHPTEGRCRVGDCWCDLSTDRGSAPGWRRNGQRGYQGVQLYSAVLLERDAYGKDHVL
jgi:hypothetical protein